MPDPLVVEPSASHDASIIWMHGLGASAYDFVDIPRLIPRPGTRWIFPNAPVRPVTLNNGWKMPSWFDIRYLAGQSEGERECPIEAQESSDMIAEIIDDCMLAAKVRALVHNIDKIDHLADLYTPSHPDR